MDGMELEDGVLAARPKGPGSRHAHPVRAACLRHGLACGILFKPIFNFLRQDVSGGDIYNIHSGINLVTTSGDKGVAIKDRAGGTR
jgi:hypothetical protein